MFHDNAILPDEQDFYYSRSIKLYAVHSEKFSNAVQIVRLPVGIISPSTMTYEPYVVASARIIIPESGSPLEIHRD